MQIEYDRNSDSMNSRIRNEVCRPVCSAIQCVKCILKKNIASQAINNDNFNRMRSQLNGNESDRNLFGNSTDFER